VEGLSLVLGVNLEGQKEVLGLWMSFTPRFCNSVNT
jgi:transposase-like protein